MIGEKKKDILGSEDLCRCGKSAILPDFGAVVKIRWWVNVEVGRKKEMTKTCSGRRNSLFGMIKCLLTDGVNESPRRKDEAAWIEVLIRCQLVGALLSELGQEGATGLGKEGDGKLFEIRKLFTRSERGNLTLIP